jgi:hypothetical protein
MRVVGHQIGYLMQQLLANEIPRDHFLNARLGAPLRTRLDLDISLVLAITIAPRILSRHALNRLRYSSRSGLPAPDLAMHLSVDCHEGLL